MCLRYLIIYFLYSVIVLNILYALRKLSPYIYLSHNLGTADIYTDILDVGYSPIGLGYKVIIFTLKVFLKWIIPIPWRLLLSLKIIPGYIILLALTISDPNLISIIVILLSIFWDESPTKLLRWSFVFSKERYPLTLSG